MAMRMNSGREEACPNQALYTFITFLLHVCVVWYGAVWCGVVWCVRERERERERESEHAARCVLYSRHAGLLLSVHKNFKA